MQAPHLLKTGIRFATVNPVQLFIGRTKNNLRITAKMLMLIVYNWHCYMP